MVLHSSLGIEFVGSTELSSKPIPVSLKQNRQRRPTTAYRSRLHGNSRAAAAQRSSSFAVPWRNDLRVKGGVTTYNAMGRCIIRLSSLFECAGAPYIAYWGTAGKFEKWSPQVG